MSKKKKKRIYTLKILCTNCNTMLYKYQKEGAGSLVKCFVSGIIDDRTNGDLKCPNCDQDFARLGDLGGRSIHRIIQGKVFTKGHCKK